MSTLLENNINHLLDLFETISLEQMDKVSFQKRSDTKYVFHINLLEAFLKDISTHYRLLIVNNSGYQKYKTVYFDTPSFAMFQQHHNGLRNRYKVRTRQYVNSNLSFLEVKVKDNKGITSKNRIRINGLDQNILEKEFEFLNGKSPFSPSDIEESIKNEFSRITLVNKKTPERITIDWNLSYISKNNRERLAIPNACVLEIKRNLNAKNRALDKILKDFKIYPSKFSKYCMGVSLMEPSLKINRFKPLMYQLRKKEILQKTK